MTSLSRALASAALVSASAIALFAAPAKADTTPPAIRIVDASSREVGEQALASASDPWAAYARARRDAVQQRMARGTWNHATSDFDAEFAGQQALVAHWRAEHGAAITPGARALLALADAGFLDEYVIETGLVPGWTLAPEHVAQVDLPAYQRWRRSHPLPELGSPGLVLAIASANSTPVAVDAGLPSPAPFWPGDAPCAESRTSLDSGVARWRAIEATLTGAALELPETFEDLALALSRPTSRERGVVFTEGVASAYLFIAGWCAVDRQDWDAAGTLLRDAVQLSPWRPQPRLELAQVEIMRKRLGDADVIVEDILATAKDPCVLGVAWRKRGFIRYEQGQFEDARNAYLKSLVHDPESQLALSELSLLNAEISKHGGTAIEWTPPPTEQLTTACHAGRQGDQA